VHGYITHLHPLPRASAPAPSCTSQPPAPPHSPAAAPLSQPTTLTSTLCVAAHTPINQSPGEVVAPPPLPRTTRPAHGLRPHRRPPSNTSGTDLSSASDNCMRRKDIDTDSSSTAAQGRSHGTVDRAGASGSRPGATGRGIEFLFHFYPRFVGMQWAKA
jgi:hypothetical protein